MQSTAMGRYILPLVKEYLVERMVFVGGPRQVGKTTLCTQFLGAKGIHSPAYLNWDNLKARKAIRSGEIPTRSKIICFDEIHKFKLWRSFLKGLYDTQRDRHQFLVTGSARLDHYRKGGDSLLGRYRLVRLHPLSLGELSSFTSDSAQLLLRFGGFPEVFLRGEERFLKLWHRERTHRIIYDDIRDLERVREMSYLELLVDALPERVGSPLSLRSLGQDLEVHPQTVRGWVGILDNVFYSFRISPYGSPKVRAVKKEQKLYLWDWSCLTSLGAKFENMVASQLLKYCHYIEDREGDVMELRYLRDTDKREVDFVVLKNKKPLFAVECKSGERGVSPHILYFKERTSIPKFYQVHLGHKHFDVDAKVTVVPFYRFCQDLKMP